jgi:hypothetical protein
MKAVALCGGCNHPLGPEAVRIDAGGTRWLEPHTHTQCAEIKANAAATKAAADKAKAAAETKAFLDNMQWKDFTGKGGK